MKHKSREQRIGAKKLCESRVYTKACSQIGFCALYITPDNCSRRQMQTLNSAGAACVLTAALDHEGHDPYNAFT